MLALSEWRHYLMGAAEDVEIWTDHQNLQYSPITTEVEQKTSTLGYRASRVSLHTTTQAPAPSTRRLISFRGTTTMTRGRMTTTTL